MTEPSADIRQLASFLWQTYVALLNEGFSEQQALQIVANVLRPGSQS